MVIFREKPKKGLIACGLLLLSTGFDATSAFAANTAQITITATVNAECSVSAPPTVDLGDIPFAAFNGKNAGEELTDYSKSFNISTTCSGTNKYRLAFTTPQTNYNCMTATSGNLGFCLYDKGTGGNKIMLADVNSIEGEGTGATFRIVPVRVGTPTVGTHAASLTITISPM